MSSAGFILYDGAPVSTTSELGKELVKWETRVRNPRWTPEGNPFPKMLYKAEHRKDGKRSVHEVFDHLFSTTDSEGRRIVPEGAAEAFNRRKFAASIDPNSGMPIRRKEVLLRPGAEPPKPEDPLASTRFNSAKLFSLSGSAD